MDEILKQKFVERICDLEAQIDALQGKVQDRDMTISGLKAMLLAEQEATLCDTFEPSLKIAGGTSF